MLEALKSSRRGKFLDFAFIAEIHMLKLYLDTGLEVYWSKLLTSHFYTGE